MAKAPLLVRRWLHHWQSDSGDVNLSLARHRGGLLLRVPGLADFLIAESCDALRARPFAVLDEGALEHLLIDQVLPRLLAQQGELMLHAGAVEIEGRVALFIGESGRGKSTWSAILQRQGHRILSDDCVLVREGAPTVRALPTYPSLRMWPDVLERLCAVGDDLGRSSDFGGKRRVRLRAQAVPAQGLDVAAIYFLEAAAPENAGPTIENLSPGRTCLELTRNTFRLDPTDLGRTTDLLARTATVAQSVPAFSLHYARDLAALPAFARRVAAHARRQHGQRGSATATPGQRRPGRQPDSREASR